MAVDGRETQFPQNWLDFSSFLSKYSLSAVQVVGEGEKWGWWRQVKIGQSLFFSTSTSWLLYLTWGGARQKKQIHTSWCCWPNLAIYHTEAQVESGIHIILQRCSLCSHLRENFAEWKGSSWCLDTTWSISCRLYNNMFWKSNQTISEYMSDYNHLTNVYRIRFWKWF